MSHDLAELLGTYRYAWLAALLIALGGSVVGVYVVLRRVAFAGIATAQVAAAGVAGALLLDLPPLPLAVATAFAFVSLFALSREPVRVSRDGLVGAAFAVASALATLFVARSGAELHQVEHVLYGTLLFTTQEQVVVLGAGTGLVLVLHAAFAREFLAVSCDPDSAAAFGFRTRIVNLLLFGTLGIVVALSIGTAGSLLGFAFLILPALTGLLLARRVAAVFAVAILAGVLTAILGILASLVFDLPTGPAVVVTGGVLLASAGAARLHPGLGAGGLVAAALLAVLAVTRIGADVPAGAGATPPYHVDLELATDAGPVRRGEPLAVDWVAHVRGPLPRDLHLMVDAGGAVAIMPLSGATPQRAGRIVLATDDLAPGTHTLSASLWIGDPFQDAAPKLLPPDVCRAASATVEVRP